MARVVTQPRHHQSYIQANFQKMAFSKPRFHGFSLATLSGTIASNALAVTGAPWSPKLTQGEKSSQFAVENLAPSFIFPVVPAGLKLPQCSAAPSCSLFCFCLQLVSAFFIIKLFVTARIICAATFPQLICAAWPQQATPKQSRSLFFLGPQCRIHRHALRCSGRDPLLHSFDPVPHPSRLHKGVRFLCDEHC